MSIDKPLPVRVLHIASGDLWAGAEMQLYTLAKALKNNTDINIDIVLLNHGELEKKLLNSGINIIVLDESKLSSLLILWKLICVICHIRPDVIHTHRLKENVLGCLAARLNGNIPTLRTVHGASEHAPSWRQLSKYVNHWLNYICGRYLQHAIIAVSEDLAVILKKDFPADKIHVIPNGVDLEEANNQIKEGDSKHLSDNYNIGFAGRLVPVKRVDILIKTARYILDKYPDLNISYHIYGDGPLRNELEQLNCELETEPFVNFRGHVDNIPAQFQKMDAMILTSDHEGLPMVLLEAMASGTAIIAHAVGGIPNLLNQGECGILVTENKPADFALAIKNLISNPEKALEIITRARRRVEEMYSAKENARAYYLQYRSLI